MTSETPRMMAVHGIILALVLYFVMTIVMEQTPKLAESRAVTIGALAIVYMVQIGHKMPKNPLA